MQAVRRRWHPLDVPQWWIVSIGAVLPLLVAVVSAWSHGWTSTGDFAHTELATRDVPGHLPLIGVAGRFGPFDNQHAHPGPAMAYVFAPLYRLFGSSSEALLAATAVVHLAGLVIAVWAAQRIGGRSLAVCAALGGALLIRAVGSETLITPWNPRMPLLVFFGYLFVCIGIAAGRARWLPLAVLLATYCAQTHISYLVLVTGLLGVVTAATLVRWWRRRRSAGPAPWKPLLVAVAVGVVAWLPVAWDQLRRTRNFGWLVGRFTHACDPRWWGTECARAVGLRAGFNALLAEGNAAGGWVTGTVRNPATASVNVIGVALTVAVVAVAVWSSVRRRDSSAIVAISTVGAAAILAIASAARVLGDFYEYVIRWSWSLAACGAAVVGWAVWRQLATWRPSARTATALVLCAGLGVGAATLVPAVSARGPYDADSRSTATLAERAGGVLDPDRTYLVRWHDPAGLGGIGFGLVDALEKLGLKVGTDSWTRFAVGQHRVVDAADADAVLFVVVGDPSITRFEATMHPDTVATFDPRSADEVNRSDEARALIERRLAELGRRDLLDRIDGQFGNAALIAASADLPADVDRAVSTYTDLRLPVALFLVPPDAAVFT